MGIFRCKTFDINYEFLNIMFQRYCKYEYTDINEIIENNCSEDDKNLKELIANDLELYKDYVKKLLTIIISNNLEIQPLTFEEIISISAVAPLINIIVSFINESSNKNLLFMSASYDDIFLYNLIKSIKVKDISLLDNVKYSNSEPLCSLIAFEDNEDYLKLLKAIKESNLENVSSNTKRLNVSDMRIFDIFIVKFREVLGMVLKENSVYGNGFILYLKRFFMNKITVLCTFAFGKFIEVLIEKSTGKEDIRKTESRIKKYTYFLVDELMKSMYNEIFSNSTIDNNILDGYTEYVKSYLETAETDILNEDKQISSTNKIGSLDDCKKLKADIKNLRKKIYNLKQKNKLCHEENTQNCNDLGNSNMIVRKEVNIGCSDYSDYDGDDSNNGGDSKYALPLIDKLKLLHEYNVVIITTLNIFDKYKELIDVINANQFKGKSLNSKYKYVVKLTCGINHHIGYDINSEAMKINAKVITCSRTNINLIVDAVLKEL